MVKIDVITTKGGKSKLLDILNKIKHIIDNPATQRDIQGLYEEISFNTPELLNNINLFKQCLLQSDNEILYNYNKSQLKRVYKQLER